MGCGGDRVAAHASQPGQGVVLAATSGGLRPRRSRSGCAVRRWNAPPGAAQRKGARTGARRPTPQTSSAERDRAGAAAPWVLDGALSAGRRCWAWAASARPRLVARVARDVRRDLRARLLAQPARCSAAGRVAARAPSASCPTSRWYRRRRDSERLTALLQLLRERRCLLVLDNSETLFEPGQQQGSYRAGMVGYGRLLEAVAMPRTRAACC